MKPEDRYLLTSGARKPSLSAAEAKPPVPRPGALDFLKCPSLIGSERRMK